MNTMLNTLNVLFVDVIRFIHIVNIMLMLTDWHDTSICILYYYLSLSLIGTVRAEHETVISRAGVQSPDPAE